MKPKLTPARFIIALLLTVTACAAILATNISKMNTDMSEQNNALKRQIEALETKTESIVQYKIQLDTLSAEISALRQDVERKADKTDRGGERGTMRMMSVTAYDLSVESCGKLPNHPEYGITASGERVKEWHTVAAGKELPFGTNIYIPYFADKPNGGVFTVQDRGSAIKRDCIDVYIADNAACWKFGRQRLEVWVMEGEVEG